MDTRAYLEIRSQKTRGTWPRQGPDKYIAVQLVPEGVEPLKTLNENVAEKRGITILHFGAGYYNRTGPQSSYGKALAAAKAFVAEHNQSEMADA